MTLYFNKYFKKLTKAKKTIIKLNTKRKLNIRNSFVLRLIPYICLLISIFKSDNIKVNYKAKTLNT